MFQPQLSQNYQGIFKKEKLHLFQSIRLLRVLLPVDNKQILKGDCSPQGLFTRNRIESKGPQIWMGKYSIFIVNTMNLKFSISLN